MASSKHRKSGKRKTSKPREDRKKDKPQEILAGDAAKAFSLSLIRLHRAYLRLWSLHQEKLRQYARNWLLFHVTNEDTPVEMPGFARQLSPGRPNGDLQFELVELTEQFFQTLYSNMAYFVQFMLFAGKNQGEAKQRPQRIKTWLEWIREKHATLATEIDLLEEARAFRAYFIDHPVVNPDGVQSVFFAAHDSGERFDFMPVFYGRSAEDVRSERPSAGDGDGPIDWGSVVGASKWRVPPPYEAVFDAWMNVVKSLSKTYIGTGFRRPAPPEDFEGGWPSQQPTFEVQYFPGLELKLSE